VRLLAEEHPVDVQADMRGLDGRAGEGAFFWSMCVARFSN
jgi:hypothetical protein